MQFWRPTTTSPEQVDDCPRIEVLATSTETTIGRLNGAGGRTGVKFLPRAGGLIWGSMVSFLIRLYYYANPILPFLCPLRVRLQEPTYFISRRRKCEALLGGLDDVLRPMSLKVHLIRYGTSIGQVNMTRKLQYVVKDPVGFRVPVSGSGRHC